MKLLFNYSKVDVHNANYNGIQLIERDSYNEIYTDPFGTVPLFITRGQDNEVIIFSDFEKYYSFNFVKKEVDEIGFWEIILFGSALWTRTLYKDVQQIPAASCLTINKTDGQYSIRRYWDYCIKENSSIKTIEQAADQLYLIIDNIFSSLDKSKTYLLGMSGGLDSRITLAFISKHIPKDKIKLFTYGFDDNILEFKYAKGIAKSLGVGEPVFHQLKPSSYRQALSYLPAMSGGQISINHCHICDYLKNNILTEMEHISTYYSDAVFGWDCVYPKHLTDFKDNYYAKIVQSNSLLSPEIKKAIIADSVSIFSCFNPDSNFSSLDEFKYVTERNQKFHMFLSFLQGRSLSIAPVYANLDLLKYCLSVPIRFRQNKNLIDVLLVKYFKNISSRDFKNISSRFLWGRKYAGLLDWCIFRVLNRVNSMLRLLTNGALQLFNKYQTEEHERLLYSEFRSDLVSATAKFHALGLLSGEQKAQFDRLPIRSAGVAERYALISLAKIL